MTTDYKGREQFIPRLKPLPAGMGYPIPVFPTCSKGHDLSLDWAFLHTATGLRSCRECATGTVKKKRQRFAMEPAGGFPAR